VGILLRSGRVSTVRGFAPSVFLKYQTVETARSGYLRISGWKAFSLLLFLFRRLEKEMKSRHGQWLKVIKKSVRTKRAETCKAATQRQPRPLQITARTARTANRQNRHNHIM
jgi:hypothetical protein